MKKIIGALLMVTCCFICATVNYAQSVYGESWLEYDDTTNTVRAVAYSAPDYNVDVYYCAEVLMTVYEGEEYLGSQGGIMSTNQVGPRRVAVSYKSN